MKPTLFQKLRSAFKTSSSQSLNAKDNATPQWYKSDYNREQAENYLLEHEIGTFVIRKSETIQECHVLSVKVPKYVNVSEISHYLIVKSKSTSLSSLHQAKSKSSKSVYSVRGYNKEFSDLKSLVTHCSFMRDIIPVTLNLEFYRERAEQQANHRHNDFFYYSSSASSLTASESSDSDADSLNSELC